MPTRPTGQPAGCSEAALAWQTCSQEKGAKHNASSTMMQTQSAQAPGNRVLGNSCRPRTLTSKPQQSAAAHLTASSKGSRCNEEQKSWQATKQRLHNRIKEQIVSEDICSHDRAEGGGRGRKHRHRTSPRTPSGWLAGWNKPNQANVLIQRSAAAPSDVLRQDKVTESERTGNSTFWVTVHG